MAQPVLMLRLNSTSRSGLSTRLTPNNPSRNHSVNITVGDIEVFSLIDGMRDAPLREGMVRNVSVEQVKTALRAAGFPDNQAPVRFIVMALKLRDQWS